MQWDLIHGEHVSRGFLCNNKKANSSDTIMTYNFCTLFNKNYLYKGLAMYMSLKEYVHNFNLWILCMDDETHNIIEKLHLTNINLVKIDAFEDKKLRNIKNTRTPEEYCWTCTPSLPLHILRHNPGLDHIGYLDADLFFYSDPKPIYEEWDGDSILIIPHNFPPFLKHKETISGKFNVSMVLFKNDSNSLNCLKWWRNKCIEWCFRKYDNGKLGDQLYLNDWPKNFDGVHILRYKGAGVGPWNVMNYRIEKRDKNIFIDDDKLIFYHFHGLRMLKNGKYEKAKGYEISEKCLSLIYDRYISSLEKGKDRVNEIFPDFNCGLSEKIPFIENLIDRLYVTKLKIARYLWKYKSKKHEISVC